MNSQEELIENINELKLDENCYYKIIISGKRNFNFSEQQIMDQLKFKNILRLKNKLALKGFLQKKY